MAVSDTKYIFVTGGVTSSLGKGIISASLAKLLQAHGYRTAILKLTPLLNVDQSTLNPYERGECFVASDGSLTDMDLGVYERFLGEPTTIDNFITIGRIFQNVISRERRGEYCGKPVQTIPHVTDEIKRSIVALGQQQKYDIVVCEISGTVGDIESSPYIEAIRQLKWELGGKAIFVHLTLVPYLSAANEAKTKPTQHSVKSLFELGIQPDVLILRSEQELPDDTLRKVAIYANIAPDCVVQSAYIKNIYEMPLAMQSQQLDTIVMRKLALPLSGKADLTVWEKLIDRTRSATAKIKLCIIGNYTEQADAYKSLVESVAIAAAHNDCQADVRFVSSENINADNVGKTLSEFDAIIIASDNLKRGAGGKKTAIRFAREGNVPILCIGTSMQLAIDDLKEAKEPSDKKEKNTATAAATTSGTAECTITAGSKAAEIYATDKAKERHYQAIDIAETEFDGIASLGFSVSAVSAETKCAEIIELPAHCWYICTAFRPEFNNSVEAPHPIFNSLIDKTINRQKNN